MKKIVVPSYGILNLNNALFDINGTIQFDGKISKEIKDKIKDLKREYNVYLISADTRGNLKEIAKELDVKSIKIKPEGLDSITEAEAKNNELIKLGKENTAAIGNGNNDSLMLKNAALGIVIIGTEGASVKTILNADVALPDPISAIDFLLDEKKIIATLRK